MGYKRITPKHPGANSSNMTMVGIGVDDPTTNLDILGDVRIRDSQGLFFKRHGDNYAWRMRNESSSDGTTHGFDGSNDLVFEVVANSGVLTGSGSPPPSATSHTVYSTSTNALVLKESGKVCIGTSSPSHTSSGGLEIKQRADDVNSGIRLVRTSENTYGSLFISAGSNGQSDPIVLQHSNSSRILMVWGRGGDVLVPGGDLLNNQSEIVRRTQFSAKPYLVGNNASQSNLIAAQTTPFSTAWSTAYQTSNVQESLVASGTAWASRNADAQAILTLMGAPNTQHFLGNFNIRRVTAARTAGTSGYTFPYQQVQMPGAGATVTHAAFVKHISGPVPSGWWCNGLTSGGGWQWCKTYTTSDTATGYNHTHPYTTNTNPSTPTVILVALPGSVPQYIASGAEWALFMMGPN